MEVRHLVLVVQRVPSGLRSLETPSLPLLNPLPPPSPPRGSLASLEAFKVSLRCATNLVGFRCRRTMWASLLAAITIGSAQAADCSVGHSTTLEISMEDVPRVPRLDQGIGKSHIVLHDQASGVDKVDVRYDGRWSCLAVNEARSTYLLAGVSQLGAWLPLASIEYLHEDGSWRTSAFDRAQHVALAAVVSPSGRYLAYIGGPRRADRLYLLDVQADTIRELGPAPSPPPADAGLANICGHEHFGWGSCWADGLTALDAGILWFASDHELDASYGRDTAHGRAKRRTVRRFTFD